MKHFAFAACLAFAPLAVQAQSPADSTDIVFTFETGAQTGAAMVALFDSEESYGSGQAVRGVAVDVSAGQTEATFRGLPAGDYAMRAFHDVNGDGEMNTNPFGMPTEPYAFSNNARGNMGPASWERARFAASGATTQSITIR